MSIVFKAHEVYFRPPMDERLIIYPKPRQDLFKNLLENYPIFYPELKLIYAALNYDSELKIDYIVIFHSKAPGKENMLIWDAPFQYSNRSIPSYRYAVKQNLYNDFFKECVSHFCVIRKDSFNEFLTSDLCKNLSLDKNDPKYWKLPENTHDLISGMSDMGLRYKPSTFKATPPAEWEELKRKGKR